MLPIDSRRLETNSKGCDDAVLYLELRGVWIASSGIRKVFGSVELCPSGERGQMSALCPIEEGKVHSRTAHEGPEWSISIALLFL